MKILINFASRSRPIKFHQSMENLRACFTNYEVLVKVDRDDPMLREYLSKAYPEIILALGHSKSKVDAINRGVDCFNWDILVNTSDDIVWKKGAGAEILNHIEPDCFLHFPESYAQSQAEKKKINPISVVSIMDTIYYQRFGYVYHPDYISLWCDNEATEVARKLGKYKFVPKYIFEHMHPSAGRVPKDDQYRRTEQFYSRDKQIYLRREQKSFNV